MQRKCGSNMICRMFYVCAHVWGGVSAVEEIRMHATTAHSRAQKMRVRVRVFVGTSENGLYSLLC